MTCLDAKYTNVVQHQNIAYAWIEHEIVQLKLRNLEMLTTDHDIRQPQSEKDEELTHIETGEIILNESNSQSGISEEINQMIEDNQNKILNQTEVKIEPY